MNVPWLGWARIRHARLRPVEHAFEHGACFLLLPMRTLRAAPGAAGALAIDRPGWIAFHGRDHGDGRRDSLAWLDDFLHARGVHDAAGEAWLQCFPRVLGHRFKPVSFWFCHRADDSLRAIVAEVNNTFGERHFYLLDAAAWGREQHAAKRFHVSPFCAVEGGYRFRFLRSADGRRNVARIDLDDAQGTLLRTSISGQLEPATRRALLRAVLRFPLLSLGIVARIHWQALRLWLAGVPVIPHPSARADSRT
jgi:uncharacterized protein